MESRWRLEHHQHTGGGLFELETTEWWRIYEGANGRLVREFSTSSSASYDGVGWSGGWSANIRGVEIEGDEAVVTLWDGRVERVPLVENTE